MERGDKWLAVPRGVVRHFLFDPGAWLGLSSYRPTGVLYCVAVLLIEEIGEPMELPPKPPLRRKKVQAFLSDDDFLTLKQVAEENREEPGALASRILSTYVATARSASPPPSDERSL